MRLAGYTREEPPIAAAEPAFAQGEQIRRFAAERGHQVVTVCADAAVPGGPDDAPGFAALLATIAAGVVDAVVIASLRTLSADVEGQEILLWELRSHGVPVLSTDPADDKELTDDPADAERTTIRGVLARAAEVRRTIEGPTR